MDTFDTYLVDSTGAFLQGQLEAVDVTIHMPLNVVTWHEDVQVNKIFTIADDWSSWTNSSYASTGGLTTGGKSWAGAGGRSNATPTVELEKQKRTQQAYVWKKGVEWTLIELESAQKLGAPIDLEKVQALQLMYNQEVDAQVYMGDTDLGVTGLANWVGVTNVTNALTGGWGAAAAAAILADVRELETSVWTKSGYAAAPTKLLIAASAFTSLLQPLSIGGVAFNSILEYIARNSVCMARNGKPLDIQPRKWLETAGSSNTRRMMAYTPDYDKVRFPITPLMRAPITFQDIYQKTTYYSKIGVVEIVYPSTVGYRDAI